MITNKVGASRRIVEETKRLYGTILAKPLDEKQLLRPSFKFIQEVVKSLMIETKLLRDVFNANHFNNTSPADSRQLDKKTKTEFIQKLIDYAANNRQAVANCLAAKVVAGLEPNKTNELLQSLARIAQQKLGAHDERRPRTFTRQTSGGAGSRPTSTARATPARSTPRTSITTVQTTANQNTTGGEQRDAPVANAQSGDGSSGGPAQEARVVQAEQKRKLSTGNTVATTSTSTSTSGKQYFHKNLIQFNAPVTEAATTITSESDIARGTQFVRGNLKSLKETFATICKVEDSLRASLILAIRDRARDNITTAS